MLDLTILSSVRHAAIDRDSRAQVLYYGKARLPAFIPKFASWHSPAPSDEQDADTPIDPRVAEAMIARGLEVADEATSPKSARSRRRRAKS